MNINRKERRDHKGLWTLALGLQTFFALFVIFAVQSLCAQTAVMFPLAQMTGNTNDTTVTIRPVNNPVRWKGLVYWLPPSGIQLKTVNGSATTNLIPNDYFVTVANLPASWKISVPDTNVTLNASEIGNLTAYTFSQSLPGVMQIVPGNNITISPASGDGVVTINSLGGNGGSATNAYQTGAGNNLVTITTNTSAFTYTIFGVSQTNGYPWGPLYDSAGNASAATNGWPWGTLYDAAGAAHAATNGYPWGVLYDALGKATAATNGYPWGPLYDAAGKATAATNGWPWFADWVSIDSLASPGVINLFGVDQNTNPVKITISTGLHLDGSGNLTATATGGASALAATNLFVTSTNLILLDLAVNDTFNIGLETNAYLRFTNGPALTNTATHKAIVNFRQDTNGFWQAKLIDLAGGLMETNATQSLTPTTNASAFDILTVQPGFFGTNLAASWDRDKLPRLAFTNSLQTGGGGGGGGSTTFVTAGKSSTSGNGLTAVVGGKITPSVNMTVTDLGFQMVTGNSLSGHIVYLESSSGTIIAQTASLTASGADGSYIFGSITPTALSSGTTYAIVENVTSGGDKYYADDTTLTTTTDASLANGCYSLSGAGTTLSNDPSGSKAYGAINMKYTVP